jgi:hypothetical protein
MNYLDYGYAITDYKSQGATTKNVTICADSQMASFNSFYTQVTRTKANTTVYTDNKEALLANLKKDATKHSTLEYTTRGKEIEKKNKIKEEISKTIRGAGTVLAGIKLKGKETLTLLSYSLAERRQKSSTSMDTFVTGIDGIIKKLDILINKVNKKLEKKANDRQDTIPKIKSVFLNEEKVSKEQIETNIRIKF